MISYDCGLEDQKEWLHYIAGVVFKALNTKMYHNKNFEGTFDMYYGVLRVPRFMPISISFQLLDDEKGERIFMLTAALSKTVPAETTADFFENDVIDVLEELNDDGYIKAARIYDINMFQVMVDFKTRVDPEICERAALSIIYSILYMDEARKTCTEECEERRKWEEIDRETKLYEEPADLTKVMS